MNLDQLIKLAKLANNNPNEHEANAAARKVCRLIEAGNYQFVNTKEPASVGSEARTWSETRRADEPFWKHYEEIFRKREEQYKKYTHGTWKAGDWESEAPSSKPPPPPPKPPPYKREPMNWTWTGEDPDSKKRYSKQYVQKNKDCTVCFLTKLTADIREPYICGDCLWRKWNDERSKA